MGGVEEGSFKRGYSLSLSLPSAAAGGGAVGGVGELLRVGAYI